MAVQVGMTFLGRNCTIFLSVFTLLTWLGFKETTQLVEYTDVFYKGLHVDIKCNFTIREIMKIQNDPHLNMFWGQKNALASRDYGPYL